MTGAGYAVDTLVMDLNTSSPGNLKMDHHVETNSFFVKVMDYLSGCTSLKVKQLNYYITISLCDTPLQRMSIDAT